MQKRLALIAWIGVCFLGSLSWGQEDVRRLSRTGGAEGERIALVVGNDSYGRDPLTNSVNDARSMSRVLRESGFEVMLVENAGRRQFLESVDRFAGRIGRGDVGLFYYSGHGVQVDGANFLVPTDFSGKDEADIQYDTVRADKIQAKMEGSGAWLNILILDACRDNPFRSSRSSTRGLAGMSASPGTFIAFATSPGETASDNPNGQNGLYTQELVKALAEPGLTIEAVFKRAGSAVERASSRRQVPWRSSNFNDDFYFRETAVRVGGTPSGTTGPDSTAAAELQAEITFWNSISSSRNTAEYEAYLARYPRGTYAALAKSRLSDLGTDSVLPVSDAPGRDEGRPAVSRTSDPLSSRAPSPGKEWTNSLGMKFAYVSAGSFMMGSPSSEAGRDSDETQHEVRLTEGIWLGKYEVTQGQWESVMGSNPSYFKDCGKECPVEKVSWNDVQDFIKRMNSLDDGYRYRLPTEAEWEYAARAGTTGPYGGTGEMDEMGWYGGNSGGKTHPVGGKRANAWDLYDMHGNVWEWVSDRTGDYPRGSVTDPEGPSSGSYRVIRGGSWGNGARNCRSANRDNFVSGFRYHYLGFRVLRTNR